MIRILTTTAIAAACASAAVLTSANAAPRADRWFECQQGWQNHQCTTDGVTTSARVRRILYVPPPPRPDPEIPRIEIHPEGNGSVAAGGGAGGGGGGGGGGGR
ncbi:MAG TPA: hypothetical protein PKA55_19840 [Rhodoblastus sp.]|nr:hypothetical protein [Rhodoblastus sp.]